MIISKRKIVAFGSTMLLGAALACGQGVLAEESTTYVPDSSTTKNLPESDVGVTEAPNKDAAQDSANWKESLNKAGQTIGSEASRLWGEIGKSSANISRDAGDAIKEGSNSAMESLDSAGNHISNETNKFLDRVSRSSKAFADAWKKDGQDSKANDGDNSSESAASNKDSNN